MRMFLPLSSECKGIKSMEFEDLKPRNRTHMAVVACLVGFFGIHNFLLSNNVSGSIKIYLTLVALIAPDRIGLSIAIVDLLWILFDLWQICFVKALPEVRFIGSRKKAVLFVLGYLCLLTVLAILFFQNFSTQF